MSKQDEDRKKRHQLPRLPLFAEGLLVWIDGEPVRAVSRFQFGEGFPPERLERLERTVLEPIPGDLPPRERPARQRLAGEFVTSPPLLDLLGVSRAEVVAESERERVERVANEYVAERRERLRHAGRLERVDADAVRAADHRRQVEQVAARLTREDLRRERVEPAAFLGDASR